MHFLCVEFPSAVSALLNLLSKSRRRGEIINLSYEARFDNGLAVSAVSCSNKFAQVVWPEELTHCCCPPSANLRVKISTQLFYKLAPYAKSQPPFKFDKQSYWHTEKYLLRIHQMIMSPVCFVETSSPTPFLMMFIS